MISLCVARSNANDLLFLRYGMWRNYAETLFDGRTSIRSFAYTFIRYNKTSINIVRLINASFHFPFYYHSKKFQKFLFSPKFFPVFQTHNQWDYKPRIKISFSWCQITRIQIWILEYDRTLLHKLIARHHPFGSRAWTKKRMLNETNGFWKRDMC